MMPWSANWKGVELQKLRREWAECRNCPLCEFRDNIVFGVGNPDADIMLIGEAPGQVEDIEGVPFVGPSGVFLRTMIEALELDLDDFYITNMVMCRPPNNRDPKKDERIACEKRLHKEIYLVDPLLIILIGKVAMEGLAKCRDSMESSRGELKHVVVPSKATFGKSKVGLLYDAMTIYHPAYILRADAIDPKTGQWDEKGPAEITKRDLERAASLVADLKHQYANTRSMSCQDSY